MKDYKLVSDLLESRKLDKEIEKGNVDAKIVRYGKSKSYDWGRSNFTERKRNHIPSKLEQEKYKNNLELAKEAKTEVENFLKTDWYDKGAKFLDVAKKLTSVYEDYMNDIMDKHSKFKLDPFYKLWNGLANDGYEDQFNGYELRLDRKDDAINSLLLDTLKKYDQEKFKKDLKEDLVKNGYNENVSTILSSIANTYLKQIEKLMSLFKISIVVDKVNEAYSQVSNLLESEYSVYTLNESKKEVVLDKDTFKEDLVKEIVKNFKGLVSEKDLEYPIECALYWFGHDYHSGQNDVWYSILSTSDYKPSRSAKSVYDCEDDTAEMIYEFLEKKFKKEKKIEEAKELLPFITVKVTFNDGDVLITSIRTTLEGAKKYYMGQEFVSYEDDETGKEDKHKVVKVELVED